MAKNTIGQFLAALRKANGMTQQEVADRLNVSNKAVSRWERDECAPDLSLIPALAEMFGVTCDELLKGERIAAQTERKEPKVDKQVKALINRTLSGFKTLIWIALAVASVGLVCMFGISYGFYRPVIGFAVMLLFEICAFALTALAVSKARDVKAYHELFEMADDAQVDKYNGALGSLSFWAFFLIVAAVLLALPLVLVNPVADYLLSVMTLESYLIFFFFGTVGILLLVYRMCRRPYIAWVTDTPAVQGGVPKTKNRKKMNRLQVGMTSLAVLLFAVSPYLDLYRCEISPMAVGTAIAGLGCLAGNLICFGVFLIRPREERKALVLPGIRNVLLIPAAFLVAMAPTVSWTNYAPGEISSGVEVMWSPEYLGYAIALTVAVVVVFALIETVIEKYRK